MVFAPERNTGHECGYLASHFLTLHNTYAITEDGKEYGLWTMKGVKSKYLYAARHHIVLDAISFDSDMVCTNPWIKEEERLPTTMKKFKDQMYRYKFVPTKQKTPHAAKSMTLSGKTDKDGQIMGGLTDDLAFVFTFSQWVQDQILMRRFENLPYDIILGVQWKKRALQQYERDMHSKRGRIGE